MQENDTSWSDQNLPLISDEVYWNTMSAVRESNRDCRKQIEY